MVTKLWSVEVWLKKVNNTFLSDFRYIINDSFHFINNFSALKIISSSYRKENKTSLCMLCARCLFDFVARSTAINFNANPAVQHNCRHMISHCLSACLFLSIALLMRHRNNLTCSTVLTRMFSQYEKIEHKKKK